MTSYYWQIVDNSVNAKEGQVKMVQGLEKINRKISTQFKLLELGEKETERLLTKNKAIQIEKHF